MPVKLSGLGEAWLSRLEKRMPREEPAARTLKSMELPDDEWQDISWRNAFRWLGREAAT
jgi:hypothetical protein